MPQPAFDAQCEDCLSFRIGGLASQLGPGMSQYALAKEVAAHVQARRGYALAFGGYHTQGGGFWLSAAYWANIGVFLLKGDRGRSLQSNTDVDLLIKAFSTGVTIAPEQGMLDPQHYVSQRLFIDVVSLPSVSSLRWLLSSSHISHVPKPGYDEVTLAEYLPVARGVGASARRQVNRAAAGLGQPKGARARALRASSAPSRSRRPLRPGERCDRCGEVVRERALLTSVYLGCGCE